VVTEESSWVFLAGPIVAFGCYLIVPLLIPVLTTYGLPLGYLGGGTSDISGDHASCALWREGRQVRAGTRGRRGLRNRDR
jgi:hypothetical protein